jgi:hypothetical protein
MQLILTPFQRKTFGLIFGISFFFVKEAYLFLLGDFSLHPLTGWMWMSVAQLKHKVFFLVIN